MREAEGFSGVVAAADQASATAFADAEIAARFGRYKVDVASWTTTWSAGVAAIFGRSQPADGVLDLDDHISCYHPDDAAASRAALAAAIAGPYIGRPYRTQGRVLRPDGTVRHVMAQGTGFADEGGHFIASSGILIDVTDTVNADQEAKEKGELLQATLDAMDQGIMMVGADRRIRVANDMVHHLLGVPAEIAAPGTPFEDFLRYQTDLGEFDGLSEDERQKLPIWSAGEEKSTYVRQRPNGAFVEICTAPLVGGGFVRTYSDVTGRQRREIALADSEQRYRLLAEKTTDTIILSDPAMRRRYVSPSVRALLGYEPHELIGKKPTESVHEDDIESFEAEIAAMCASAIGQGRTRKRYRRKDGSIVWVDIAASAIRDPDTGATTGYVINLRDHSAQVAAEDDLRLSEQRLAFALSSGGDGVWSYDVTRDRVVLAGRWSTILGYRDDEIEPTFAGWDALTHPDDRDRVRNVMIDHLKGRSAAIEVEYRMRTKVGSYVWTLARGKAANVDADGRATLVIGTHMDITRRKEAELALAHTAHHDALTGLANRNAFHGRLEREIDAARHRGNQFALLTCDLDRFKAVNDVLGHGAGDELLRLVAERLNAVVRADDLVARLGGDEFAIVLGSIESLDDARAAAERIVEIIGLPFDVAGQRLEIGASIGIAFGPADGECADELCRRSDAAMYVAKAAGRACYRVFEPMMDAIVRRSDLGERAAKQAASSDAIITVGPVAA